MSYFDWINIGTSNFGAFAHDLPGQRGISIEPVKTYLDGLPDWDTHIKMHCAATHNKSQDFIDLYWIPPNAALSLPPHHKHWSGLNAVGGYHMQHIKHGVEKFVQIDKVPLKNIAEIFLECDVTGVGRLKIDTEGYDCLIMTGVYEWLKDHPRLDRPMGNIRSPWAPTFIEFETNSLCSKEDVDEVIKKFDSIGYYVSRRDHDTFLKLRPNL